MAVSLIFRQLRIRFRLYLGIATAVAVGLACPGGWPHATKAIVALDAGGIVFLTLTWAMMARSTPTRLRLRARMQDEAKLTILLLTVGAALFSLAAIGLELHGVKDLPAGTMALHIGMAAASIVCAWLVTHTLFALHYAHDFYGDAESGRGGGGHAGGLEFPGCEHPDYWDFLYFAFVIGMTCQTSDVQITDRGIRRLALAQAGLAFIFNTVILALSINIAAGLL